MRLRDIRRGLNDALSPKLPPPKIDVHPKHIEAAQYQGTDSQATGPGHDSAASIPM